MGLEGLEYILNKREVVPTVSSLALLERPEQVEDDYRRHVRTYVPISRAAAGNGDQMSVEKFEQRVIQQVTTARSPRGYITADYGYGKTSTALYLWQRAEAAGLLAVPPFQLQELSNLIDAAHGWMTSTSAPPRPALRPPPVRAAAVWPSCAAGLVKGASRWSCRRPITCATSPS